MNRDKDPVFFLGGIDLEMKTIIELLSLTGHSYCDKKLGWGAKASSYKSEIEQAFAQGLEPVLVELDIDTEFSGTIIDINHHGNRSGEPASIIQVLTYLGKEPTRYQQLVAANDSGYIPAMIAMGASEDEVATYRWMDREAQGVTEEMEAEAIGAINISENVGKLRIVKLSHTKFATVTDRLFTSWEDGKEKLLVICESNQPNQPEYEVYYFGRGDVCEQAKEKFAGFGGGQGFGKEDGQGFAGCKTDDPSEFRSFIEGFYS